MIAAVIVTVASIAGTAPAPARCVFETPCVYAPVDDLAHVSDGTVLAFQGRGWPPRARVAAEYGSFCSSRETVCGGVGLETRFRADRHGRFTFRLRVGSRPPSGAGGPDGAGSADGISFAGRTPAGNGVTRTPAVPPPPSTPRQRAEAAGVRTALQRLARDLRPVPARGAAAEAAYEREIGRCQDILRIERPRGRAAVIDRDTDAAADAAIYGPATPELLRFARRLERLGLTDPELRAGADAWIAAIRAPRHVPQPSLCDELGAWRDRGYPLDAPPVDPALPGLDEEVRGRQAVRIAARRLRELGAGDLARQRFAGAILGAENFIEI